MTHSIQDVTLDELWSDVPEPTRRFEANQLSHLPGAAQRYLKHAIADETPLASAVRLTMVGEIKLGEWRPFEAEQVIRWDRGLIWRAKAKMGLLSVKGSDRFIDGQGAMLWKLLGLIPVMRADGPDISRSAAGRLQAEAIWLPAALLGEGVHWHTDGEQPTATIHTHGYEAVVRYRTDDTGRLVELVMPRWGNPEGGVFHEAPFGAFIDEESTFGGYTIPTRIRVGWHFGTERFETEGEFFRATVKSAEYR